MNRVFSDQRNIYHKHIQQKKAKKNTGEEKMRFTSRKDTKQNGSSQYAGEIVTCY